MVTDAAEVRTTFKSNSSEEFKVTTKSKNESEITLFNTQLDKD